MDGGARAMLLPMIARAAEEGCRQAIPYAGWSAAIHELGLEIE